MKNSFILLLFICGCADMNNLIGSNISSNKTQLEPLPIRAGFRDDEIIVAINIVSQPKFQARARSIVEIRITGKSTHPSDSRRPVLNGFLVGPRVRW
jgi:hypothetical protein